MTGTGQDYKTLLYVYERQLAGAALLYHFEHCNSSEWYDVTAQIDRSTLEFDSPLVNVICRPLDEEPFYYQVEVHSAGESSENWDAWDTNQASYTLELEAEIVGEWEPCSECWKSPSPGCPVCNFTAVVPRKGL